MGVAALASSAISLGFVGGTEQRCAVAIDSTSPNRSWQSLPSCPGTASHFLSLPRQLKNCLSIHSRPQVTPKTQILVPSDVSADQQIYTPAAT